MFEPKPSFESEPSFESKTSSYDSEINLHFACQLLEYEFDIYHDFGSQLLEDEPEDDVIQSSKILGSFYDKSNQLNVSPPPS